MPVLPSPDVLSGLTQGQRQLVEERAAVVQVGQWVELKKGLGPDYPARAIPATPPQPPASSSHE